jgi:rhamnulokinase
MLGNPVQYRDARTNGMMERAFELAGREEIFELTGVQFIYINSLYQLLSLAESKSASLERARTFLMIPALFNYWLCGSRTCEFTIATTSQCYDPRAKGWATKMLEKLGIPTGIFPQVVPPGTVLGKLNKNVAKETGAGEVPVIAPACHDTGSAVAAVPARDKGRAFISSGTWSLVGVEVAEPVITRQSRALNFTNEGGVCGTFRLLKNVTGLWLLQECRRAWMAEGGTVEYAELTEMASRAPESKTLLDPDDASFAAPGDMPKRIAEYFTRIEKPVPQDRGAMVRCILDSLAAKYCDVIKSIETLTGNGVNEVVIVGGGSKNGLLNQLTADRLGRRVMAGPVEATAIGNVLMQMLALGDIKSLDEGRGIVSASFEVKEYEPRKA